MATACPKCSTENADGALVCRHCGAALPPPPGNWSRSLLPEDDHFDPLSAPTLVMQHTAPATLPPIQETLLPPPARRDPRRILLGVAGVVLLVASGAWLLRPAGTTVPPATPAQAGPAAASAAAPVASIASIGSIGSTASAAAPAPAITPPAGSAPANDPPAMALAAPPVASAAAASSAAPAPAPASAAPGRKRIPEPVSRKRAQVAAPVASSPAPVAPVASAPAPVVAPPPAPERQKTVGELCAGGNLITRGFCEQRECGRGEHANDPVCARLKEAEQRRLFQQ